MGGRPAGLVAPARRIVGVVGELLVTLGVIAALFVFYQLYWTGLAFGREQARAADELRARWDARPAPTIGAEPAPPVGGGLAVLRMPTVEDNSFVVVEGIGRAELARGPGHYPDSALPGQSGNVALAGHRMGRGAPFIHLDGLATCDPITLETAAATYEYRVLPVDGGGAAAMGCVDEATRARLDGPGYAGLRGRHIVAPGATWVVGSVPQADRGGAGGGRAGRDAAGTDGGPQELLSLLTLTTCHPWYDNTLRMIVHAVLASVTGKG